MHDEPAQHAHVRRLVRARVHAGSQNVILAPTTGQTEGRREVMVASLYIAAELVPANRISSENHG